MSKRKILGLVDEDNSNKCGNTCENFEAPPALTLQPVYEGHLDSIEEVDGSKIRISE